MRYVVLIHVDENITDGPPVSLIDAMLAHVADRSHATVVTDAGLTPTSAATRVASRGGDVTTTDGPFAEAKEVISYAVYSVRSKEEAVEWGRRFLDLHRQHWPGWDGTIDVLKVFGPEDMGPPA